MFRSLRWELAFWFIGLTTVVYLAFTSLATVLFNANLTAVLDGELQALAIETEPSIQMREGRLRLPSWEEGKRRKHNSLPATIQLFDVQGNLLEQYGADAPIKLFQHIKEIPNGKYSNRIWCTELIRQHKLVGFFQVQLSTRLRDRALRQFGQTMSSVLPVLVLALGGSGYIFSGLAIRPIEQSFKVLRDFMTDAGHELATPISIIQVQAESMESGLTHKADTSTSDAILDKNIEMILRSTERMSNLVKDLSLLAKMESPQLTLMRTPLQFDDCVKDVTEELKASFQSKGVQLNCGEIEAASMLGDVGSLKRMITNLLQNALQYTNSGGCVTVQLGVQGRNIKLSVADTGIGIPKESIRHVFDRFYRVDKSRSRSAGGTGLGLAIVKAIVKAHRGQVEVKSEPGSGSVFSVIFPLKR